MALPRPLRRASVVRDYVRPLIEKKDIGGGVMMARTWGPERAQETAVLIDLCEMLDERLLAQHFDAEKAVTWELCLAAMRSVLKVWDRGVKDYGMGTDAIRSRPGHPAELVLELLEGCPDEPMSAAETRLSFIRDPKLRQSIGRDVDSLDALLPAAEWKAATVLGGSVIEALLLDRLIARKYRAKALAFGATKGWKSDPAKWDLADVIEAAEKLGVIAPEVAGVCSGARDFRNLIHAGKERARVAADRGTAHVVYGAVHRLMTLFGHARKG